MWCFEWKCPQCIYKCNRRTCFVTEIQTVQDNNCSVTRFGGEGGGKEEENEQNSIIAPYIYDARHHANPYILSTTVLSDIHIVHLAIHNIQM